MSDPFSWLDKMASEMDEYRTTLLDDGQTPDGEQALRQFIYDTILDFIERDKYRLIADLLDEDFDLERTLSDWVDQPGP